MNKKRLEKVIKNMEKYNIDQMIVTSSDSIFYLLGEWIHPGERMLALFIDTNGEAKLFVNELFPITKDLGVKVHIHKDTDNPIDDLAEVIDESKVVGIDKEWPSRFLISLLKKKNGLKVENGSIVVDEARMIKDEQEIELMRKASAINDKAMEEIIEFIKKGCSEIEASKKLAEIYSKYGCSGFSFEPLICYGANAAEPHHASDNTELKENSCIIIDIGCIKDDYASDMTRSLFYGKPDEEYKKIYDLVYKANKAAIEAVKPGVKFSDIDRAARKVIEDGGYGKYFIHRTGHNIGINVHEYPDVSSSNDMEVVEGMVFSIEPGIYLEGKYGVRIEDLVVVTKDGCEVLNKFTKDLIVFD
ncbi:Xaa-Pro dipeptidase [Caminicella sporogenes DSM 14501]|uniref:Xaa-Pro dipeptidase n=1 Tax=Caminicella sporogenes DSM 14501 TaxID=1121266 RepID=A0A1M6Q7Z6_9FIRM|nr:Xaa-Pro peptidase family protein [Caminicella sporogenes]RKD23609.1 proline dipeptidase [Caminicella sporogenes]SHK16270.1 Xaa-Pro dipeptidase [Caminicella sporogenes DSM 14501]